MNQINIPGVSFLEFQANIVKIIVKFQTFNFFQKNENLSCIILDLISDILKRNLSNGTIHYPNFLIEFTKNTSTIVFTIDLIDSCNDISKNSIIKLSKQEKLDVLHGLEMLNHDSVKTKIVITREIFKELTFTESLIVTFKDIYKKFIKE
jgi:hypothetical protein